MTVLTSGCGVSGTSMSFLGLGRFYFVRLALLRLDFETQNCAKTGRHNFSLLQLGLLKSFVKTDLNLQRLLTVAQSLSFHFVFVPRLPVRTSFWPRMFVFARLTCGLYFFLLLVLR